MYLIRKYLFRLLLLLLLLLPLIITILINIFRICFPRCLYTGGCHSQIHVTMLPAHRIQSMFVIIEFLEPPLGNYFSFQLVLHGWCNKFSFQLVLHDWCNKSRCMCYPDYGMVHIKEPLLLIGKSSLCGGSGFPFSLSEWSLTICLTPYNRE